MTGRILRLSPIALVLVVAACGGGGGTTTITVAPTTTSTTSPTTTAAPAEATSFRVYFLLKGKVQPVERTVPKTKAVATAAYEQLLKGPTKEETGIGLSTALPADTDGTIGIGSDGMLSLSTKQPLTGDALAQTVYTLTQFPGRQTVVVNGKEYTRNDFEDVTPAILAELPLPFERVAGHLRLAGTSNTFEATFQYELTDTSGAVLAKHFVTATSGNGIRGTFDVTIPFTVSGSRQGTLSVYETSAATGKRVNQVDIPLTLEP
jgi:immunoglobulin-like protein involved in spore germination/sporulation and spore germination protein